MNRRRLSKKGHTPELTTHHIVEILPKVLRSISKVYQDRPDLLLQAWPAVVGERLAPMTRAVSFNDGFLLVHVKNSTLYSLLSTTDKPRIIKSLREKFPQTNIKSVIFRLE
ncbi:MAG: DUF721 domain-containing protein [Chlamydiales bacterium]